ncbi:hypothetical protein [Tsukamurella soli]|uniref:DUF86 domain-containing protein n=1 Tax=Tsukamurella soli TaxID=644556 RepID=A0ABP8JZM5_9ACTN
MSAGTPAATLLRRAEQILDGEVDVGTYSARMAALLARRALEIAVAERCARLGAVLPERVQMRSRLAVLRVHDELARARAASFAWGQLSAVCHHHAYELAPTVDEVRALCRYVAELCRDGT